MLIYNGPQPSDFLSKQNQELESLKIKDSNNWVWYFQNFDPKLQEGKNLQLYIYDDDGRNVARVRCENANWDREGGWQFVNGIILSYRTNKGILIPSDNNDSLEWVGAQPSSFDEYGRSQIAPIRKFSFPLLELRKIDINPLPYFWVKKNPKNFSVRQLSSIISEYPDQNSVLLSPFRYKYAQMIIYAFGCAIVTFLALFLVSGNSQLKIEFLVRSIACGVIVFYLLKVSCFKLGEKGLMNPWICATLPLVGVLVSFAFFKRSKSAKT